MVPLYVLLPSSVTRPVLVDEMLLRTDTYVKFEGSMISVPKELFETPGIGVSAQLADAPRPPPPLLVAMRIG